MLIFNISKVLIILDYWIIELVILWKCDVKSRLFHRPLQAAGDIPGWKTPDIA